METRPLSNGMDDYTGRSIITLLLDKQNRLWIDIEGAGLAIYDSKSDSFSIIANTNNSLPNDVIYKLLEDSRGHIWGSTNKGIFCLNPDNMHVKENG